MINAAELICAEVTYLYATGEELPTTERTNIDGYRGGLLDVGALPEGDSAFGCRNMLGQVWEWTATAFYSFPVRPSFS